MSNNLFEMAKRAGLIEEKVEPKRSGLEIAYEALLKSHPNSPVIPYLDKLLKKQQNLSVINGVSQKGNLMADEETQVQEEKAPEEATPESK